MYGVIGATIASVGIIVALIPVAPEFQQFFRNRIGDILGEWLLGASLPLAASPPVILFYVWIHNRTKQLELWCHQCNHFFNTSSIFERVSDSGLCPACGTQQFCDADQFCQSTFVARTGPSPQQALQAALICALLLLSFGGLLIFSWFSGSGVQWLAAGIVTILAGIWYLIRQSRFRRRQTKMTTAEPIRPHPKNVDGPFYVEYGCCTSCDVPMQQAPKHFAYDGDKHCYVCRQPQTAADTTDMIGTAWMAELQCIRYRGNNPDVLRRMAELDLRELCDVQPPRYTSPLIRNHVEFSVVSNAEFATPQQLAANFVDYLTSRTNEWRQLTTKPIQISGNSASLAFSWYEDHFHVILFAADPDPDSGPKWHVAYSADDPSAHGVGNIVSHWLSCFADVFGNISWYTESDWHGPKVGHPTRF